MRDGGQGPQVLRGEQPCFGAEVEFAERGLNDGLTGCVDLGLAAGCVRGPRGA